jgi:iron complex transport system substrate-binding protein
MPVRLSRLVLCALLLCAFADTKSEPIELRDGRGVTLRLAAPAQRIIAIAPHLTEIAYAAGAGTKLVAVSAFSDYPPEALRLPRVGDGARVDIERILQLKPDLVLAWKSGNQSSDIARLEQFGIPVWVSEASRLADVSRLLRGVAQLAGVRDAGAQAAFEFEREVEALRARYGRAQPAQNELRVFYEIWSEPLITVNRDHLISEIIALCGGHNVFGDIASLTPSVTQEALIAARPHIVLGGGSAGGEAAFLARWRATPVKTLRALPVAYVAPDQMQRATPRIVGGIRAVCVQLEPHAARAQGRAGKYQARK